MKKLIKWATACAATFLFCQGVYAQTVVVTPETPPPPGSTVTVQPVGQPMGTTTVVVQPVGKSGGYNVCYMPAAKHVQGSRIVRRCGPYGCQDFKVTRDFDVRVYTNCRYQVNPCPSSYSRYGWYPNKSQARDAVNRCQNTIVGDVPGGWRIVY